MQIDANIRPLAFPDLQQAREQDERWSTMIDISLERRGGGEEVNANHIVKCSLSLAEND